MLERGYWPSRWVFILAAIGSAAGLGNLWRFPYLAFEYGGGAFVFVLILANIVIGIPLLIGEIGLGQLMRKAAPDSFGKINRKLRYLGWLAIVFGFMVTMYYLSVVGWGVDYLFSSVTLPWSSDPKAFFHNEILGLSSGPGELGGISWPVLTGMILAWALVYFSVWRGVRSVSSVVKWTATIPFLILGILIVRALTLDGAGEGLKLFFIPDWRALANPDLWLAAISQVFFSLSLAFGIMIAYGSYNREDTEITKSAIYITVGNFIVSIMSGIVVFGTLGWMAAEQGVPVTEVFAGGPSLTFIVFPQAISLLPAFNTLIAVLFFVTLLSLAIDSAFSLLEAFAAAFKDRYPSTSTKKITFLIAIVGLAGGLIFATNAGLYILDIADHFIVNYGLVIVGIFESIAIGWFIKENGLVNFINSKSNTYKIGSYWSFAMRYAIPAILLIFLITNMVTEFLKPYGGYPGWALLYMGVVPILLAPFVAIILDKLTLNHQSN